MGEPAPRLATYQDVLNAPPHSIAQIVSGELHVHPRPAGPHGAVASGLGFDLGPPFQRGRGGPGGWTICDEPELHLGPHIVVPDLAAWRREQPPELEARYFTVPPVWVCEVLSPSSFRLDRGPKADLYAKFGVEYMWLIEPEGHLVEAYQLANGAWMRIGAYSDQECVRIPPFDAIELELGPLWVTKLPEGDQP